MEKATEMTTKTLTPVFDTTGHCGHLLRSARGIKAYDSNDKLIGIYPTAGEEIIALLGAIER